MYIQYEWLKKYKIDVVIDIGAYYGYVSQALRYIFPQAFIYAFEPIEKNREKIKKNLGSKNIIISKYVLGRKNGTSKFYEYSNPSLSSLLSINRDKKSLFSSAYHINTIKLKTITLDSYFKKKNISGNVFLKIDTQGSELLILQGGKDFLKSVSVVHIETSFDELYNEQCLFAQIYSYLTKFGFTYFGESRESHFYPLFTIESQVNSIFINTRKINIIF